MSKPISFLSINNLKLSVHLGWTTAERVKKQIVWLNMKMSFLNIPKACLTDELNDTLCYATVIEHIRKKISAKKFCLIEHLAQYIYTIVKAALEKKTKLTIQITKHPNIIGLDGGVSFSYGDN